MVTFDILVAVSYNNIVLHLHLRVFWYLLGPQGVLTKFLKPQDHMLSSWPQENGEITDSEQHHTNNLYAKSPKSITATALTRFNALKGIKFHRM